MTTELTLAEWRLIYEKHKLELPNRRFTMQHGRPGRWPDDDFGPDRGPEPDEPSPDDGGDLLGEFITRRGMVRA